MGSHSGPLMPAIDHASLPPGMHVFERGWLSSNNVLFTDGEKSLLVDSGYCTHSPQTLQLVEHALKGRALDRLVNTHLHSDHCGGNAALQALYPGLETLIPPGQAQSVEPWDPVALTYLPTGQFCPRFTYSDVIAPGSEMAFGSRIWQAHAASGHDPHSLVFFEPISRTLISADALWENGFGVVFPELEGQQAFSDVAATFDLMEKLQPKTVVPGHGAVFFYSADVMARARARLDHFVCRPDKHARHAAKVLIKFKLLEKQQQTIKELRQWATGTVCLTQIHNLFFETERMTDWIDAMLSELATSGAITRNGNLILNA
jgi:glyoxylase-like metal-dependent hydrolase (beta-lactamase superfamily II)